MFSLQAGMHTNKDKVKLIVKCKLSNVTRNY